MKRNISMPFRYMLQFIFVALISNYCFGEPYTLTEQSFDKEGDTGKWDIGSQSGGEVSISKEPSLNHEGSLGSLVARYPTPIGGSYAWAVYDLSELNSDRIYVEFWAKMPEVKHGLKFLKVFGRNAGSTGGDTNNYSNTTFGLNYNSSEPGGLSQVAFGDGSKIANDTQNVVNLDGAYKNWIGRSFGTATINTPQNASWDSNNWGTDWHHFRFYVKYNSGDSAENEVADGELYAEVDGKVYVQATNVFNRHFSNGPIDRIELFGWSQGGSSPFEIWIDNITVSTENPLLSNAPKPPSNVIIK